MYPHRAITLCWPGVAALALALGACSAQISDPAELGPRRTACAPVGACRPCPCPGSRDTGYQLCDAQGYFVDDQGQLGCTCPPPPAAQVPAACIAGSAGAGGN